MDRMIYTALSGAQQSLERQAVVANNLSNVSTTGFKSQLSAFRAVSIQGDGLATRSVVADTTPGADYSEGMIEETGRSLDVAIDGDGWLAVDDGNGREAYTRDGRLRMDATGLLMSDGKPVMGEGGPIFLPLNASVSVASDGTISALGLGDQPNTLAEVGRLKLVNPGTDLKPGRQIGLNRGHCPWLTGILIKKIFECGTGTLETGRTDVGQVVGYHIKLGLLSIQPGLGDPERANHRVTSSSQ